MPRALSVLALCLSLGAAPTPGYYRYPSIGAGQVYFTAEGDLWRVPVQGGSATRLTTHPAQEIRPVASPDGRLIAFTAAYDGPLEVYVMPLQGGVPRRLTFEGTGSQVLGWTPQGEVLYATQATTGPSSRRVLATVHPESRRQQVLPLADAGEACMDDKGRVLYFVRMGIASTGDNARNYRGGAAAELWRYDLVNGGEAERIPTPAPFRSPMWWQGRLYGVTDKDGCDNLWSMKPDGTDARPLTQHRTMGVRTANLGDGRIAYQLGADVRMVDLATGRDERLAIDLVSDFDQQRERLVRRPLDFLDNTAFALQGDKVVFTARGQVAVAGLNGIRRVDVAVPAGSRAREAVLSKDGKWVYAICDATGEQQVWRLPADGRPGGTALTSEKGLHRMGLFPSPDGASLAHTDRQGRVFLLDLASGANKVLDEGRGGDVPDLVWAPDGKTLAIQRAGSQRQMRQIILKGLDGQGITLTSDKYESFDPAFTPDGRWCYFLSNRSFQVVNGSPWGDRNMGPYFDRRTRVYAVALQPGLTFPFTPKTELDLEAAPRPEGKGAGKEAKDAKEAKAEPRPAIQWSGLADRLFEVPLPAGNYGALRTDGKRLYFLDHEGRGSALKTLEIGNNGTPADVFAGDLAGFDLSADGRKVMMVRRQPAGQEVYIVDAGAKAPMDLSKASVRVGDWTFTVDPRVEWRQMFQDAWRMHRDQFFDANLRGLDWEAVRKTYEPLVDRVTDRAELNDVLAQMMGELGALHSQTRPGDQRLAQDAMASAYLGAVLERVPEGSRIAKVYRTERELPSEAGPLSQPGMDVREGDIITAVNGRPVKEARDISDLLRNRAGQQVLLNLRRGGEELKPVIVTPVDGMRQASLRYSDWEEACRQKVEEAGKGRIGYLHLRAMGPSDINTFAREFYGQFDREGLVIDVRRNNGGNIDSWVIEKLMRRAWAFWTNAKGQYNGTNMQQTFRGKLVVLVDELTYSDGETFAAGIKHLGLAPLVGRRTAGAGVWLTDSNRLVDGGQVRAAEWPQFAVKDGAWLIEGQGVAPDVEVVNLPKETFEGRDRQLETAIKLLQEQLAKDPVPVLKPEGVPTLASGKKAKS